MIFFYLKKMKRQSYCIETQTKDEIGKVDRTKFREHGWSYREKSIEGKHDLEMNDDKTKVVFSYA